jgi:hypothetical protein
VCKFSIGTFIFIGVNISLKDIQKLPQTYSVKVFKIYSNVFSPQIISHTENIALKRHYFTKDTNYKAKKFLDTIIC